MTSRPPRTVYVDESLRPVRLGLCVMAAASVVNSTSDQVRREMRATLRPGQPRFHWRDETHVQRMKMLEAIGSTGSTGSIYVCQALGVR